MGAGGPIGYRDFTMMMREVFAAFEALQPYDRFQIGCLIRDPSSCFPVLAADSAMLAVPGVGATQSSFLQLLQAALIPVVDGALSSYTLHALVPRVAGLPGGVETSPLTTNRLVALVRANGYRTWEDLAGCKIADVRRWYGAGQQTTAQLVVAAVAAVLHNAPDERGVQLTLPLHAVPRNAVCAALDACLVSLPDARGRFAFEVDELRLDGQRTASADRPMTQQFIGVGAERVRQLKAAARRHILELTRQDGALEQRVVELAALVGLATDHDGFPNALAKLNLPGLSEPAGLLAIWLAGPYRAVPGHDGWWSPRPAELIEATNTFLATGGGVHTHDVVIKDLVGFGLTAAQAERWLGRQHVRIEHGVVVDLRGSAAAVAERVLEATGQAMSYRELCSWMPAEISASALATELQRNRAFIETGPDLWELADWGGEPSAHLVRLSIEVTAEEMAGTETALSSEVASLLRLRPGIPLILGTRFGPLALCFDGCQVVRGTARPVVLASGAAIGDVLWFFVDPRDLAVEVSVEQATMR